MADVRLSDPVRAALGPQMVPETERVLAADGGHCISCRASIAPAGPANVVLGRGDGGALAALWYRHPGCGPSEIIPLPREAVDAIAHPPGGHDMIMLCGLGPSGPILIAEPTAGFVTDGGTFGAEPQSLYIRGLIKDGFAMVTAEMDGPELPGWRATVQPHGREVALTISSAGVNRYFFDGMVEPPAGWVQAVQAQQQVLLLSGEMGLSGEANEAAATAHAMMTAARNGRLFAARIACG